jgi:hypothetical protein
VAGDADPARVDVLAPQGIVQEGGNVERNIERALPQLVGKERDGRIVRVGAVVVRRGDDIAVRGQRLGEPGILQRV